MLIMTYVLTATPLLRINYKPTGGAILSFRISRCCDFNSNLNRRQTQHAYYLVNTMLSAFQLKSPITAVLLPS